MLNWKRGMNTNSELKPDAEIEKMMVEYDMGTEGKKQVQRQAKRYTKTNSWVLWVFQNANRFNLLEGAAPTSNTLMMVDGSDTIYDLKGYAVPVDKLVEILGT
ncbi:hypothetical protein RMSM_03517 [Rhodopirellula maiorica SM1]|uniref:Uncharacterized protein n=2 Tax=Novipirellula TaxID=2795426 RepID=M5RVY3_9BACT|nr:hypothetical protein RMSM_03517 [Rhodopirellula maiorica SM1]